MLSPTNHAYMYVNDIHTRLSGDFSARNRTVEINSDKKNHRQSNSNIGFTGKEHKIVITTFRSNYWKGLGKRNNNVHCKIN